MAFTPKDWKDAPDHSTPLSAAALEDLETRVTGYADSGDALLVPKALVDAKGDLLVATADNTVARKAVGADDQVLTADSTDPSGVAWKPPSGGSGVALGAAVAIDDATFRNESFAAGPLSGIASWQAPTDADFYAVQVHANSSNISGQPAAVYVIRDDAHWQDFWWGAQAETTQVLQTFVGAAAGAVQVTTFTALVPAGWHLVGDGSSAVNFIGTIAIPVASA